MRALILGIGLLAALPTWGTEITWSVKNGFPVFRKPETFQAFRDAWPAKETAVDFLAGRSAEWFRTHLPKTSETLWNSGSGLYDKKELFKTTHVIVALATGTPENSTCRWFKGKVLQSPPQSCSLPKDIKVDERVFVPIRVEVSDGDPGQTDVYVKTYNIVAFGDSFASGEGNPDRAAVGTGRVTDDLYKGRNILRAHDLSDGHFSKGADWWDTTCHRSLLSWQSMYALKLALSDPHLVVRFASFSCSGAEVYDGFFRAQLNPPAEDISNRVAKWKQRDGGNFLDLNPVQAGQGPEEAKTTGLMLNKSQLNAAVHLLCPEDPYRKGEKNYGREVHSSIGRKYFGVVKYDGCRKKLQPVDEVLLAFGGNDFGFAGVTSWGLVPRGIYPSSLATSKNPLIAAYGEGKNMTRKTGMKIMRFAIGVIDPDEAAQASGAYMDKLYLDMNGALKDYLNIAPTKVKVLIYPNPLETPFQPYCEARLNMGNVALTERVVYEIGGILPNRAKAFMFLINEPNANKISKGFIRELRADQSKAISHVGWTAIDSQPALDGRTICAVSPECSESGICPEAERFAWTKGGEIKVDHPSMTPITSFARWEPYTNERTRGMRTGNDAFMTLARFNSKGDLLDDWFRGTVHPDAKAHSTIADLIKLPEIEEPKRE
ncbi:hypothetical protein ACYPKM_04750 [Pseudomonas aeruginosa]